jgi:hypothetical protein
MAFLPLRARSAEGEGGEATELGRQAVDGERLTERVGVQAPAPRCRTPPASPGIAEYVTTGWPTTSHNGPAAQALAHDYVDGPVT